MAAFAIVAEGAWLCRRGDIRDALTRAVRAKVLCVNGERIGNVRASGNSMPRPGVYGCMSWMLCFLMSFAAAAQEPQPDPVSAAVQKYWDARSEGHFEAAAAKRDEARRLLAHMPVEAP